MFWEIIGSKRFFFKNLRPFRGRTRIRWKSRTGLPDVPSWRWRFIGFLIARGLRIFAFRALTRLFSFFFEWNVPRIAEQRIGRFIQLLIVIVAFGFGKWRTLFQRTRRVRVTFPPLVENVLIAAWRHYNLLVNLECSRVPGWL